MSSPAYHPTLAEVRRLSRRGNLIPVYREILADFETPLSAYLKIEGTGPAFLLESVEGGEQVARYSFLGSQPKGVFQSRGSGKDPLAQLRDLMRRHRIVNLPGVPRFTGGLVGYVGYDVARFYEPIADKTKDDLKLPETLFLLTDTVVIFDHVEHRLKVVAHADLSQKETAQAYAQACAKIDRVVEFLQRPLPKPRAAPKKKKESRVISNVTRPQFFRMVREAKRAISQGEIIQGVLSQRFQTPVSAHPFSIYRALRSLNPSPYMFYLNCGPMILIGSSPEILVRCEGDEVRTRPIAGTRRRGKTRQEDLKMEQELKNDPKERAEHLMLVDLGRNDLGRVCTYGSVKVQSFMETERYSHVMHLVSDVIGKKRPGVDALDCLRAAFPAGTVTGAPKVRAMQIIEELEPTRRGPYAGAVGYIDFSGNMDTCITIRTILIKNGIAYVQAGAGIVADSIPKREYLETRNKAAAMLAAIHQAEQGLV